jgi:hypothetical protein
MKTNHIEQEPLYPPRTVVVREDKRMTAPHTDKHTHNDGGGTGGDKRQHLFGIPCRAHLPGIIVPGATELIAEGTSAGQGAGAEREGVGGADGSLSVELNRGLLRRIHCFVVSAVDPAVDVTMSLRMMTNL